MSVIHRYVLSPSEAAQPVAEGKVFYPLHVGWKNKELCVWGTVSSRSEFFPNAAPAFYALVRMTGQAAPPAAFDHIGTAVGGPDGIVAHVFGRHVT